NQTLVIHFLDGTTYRHRLGATPRGARLYNTKRDHSQILALYAEGCSAKEISQGLGVSENTVRSFLRRKKESTLE
ncbi:MAG: sigma factor-like helix-turn-helix DNA-binding protein, partial [Lachnospiraceae bacterium]|nr:sigma factor-like helix-turn-helix DNA-binding protein [Lachnospiraceae bacterium]